MSGRRSGPRTLAAEIASVIVPFRGHDVMLDVDLARYCSVTTSCLNRQVRRNPQRFAHERASECYLFHLTAEEFHELIARSGRKKAPLGVRRAPLAFTFHGAMMAPTVLNKPSAFAMTEHIGSAFLSLPQRPSSVRELARRLQRLDEQIHKQLGARNQAEVAIQALLRELLSLVDCAQARLPGTDSSLDLIP
jgi:hypothetical protein